MVLSYDVGSLPLKVNESVVCDGARRFSNLLQLIGSVHEASGVFEKEVVNSFIDKLKAGIDIPNFPQFRDMNEMYFELMKGIEKNRGGYTALKTPTIRARAMIPEVDAIKQNTSRIVDVAGVDKLRLKICVTGPYTLSSFFHFKTPKLFVDLSKVLKDVLSNSIFSSKKGEVSLICVDEPVLGFLNDPLLDFGSEGREALIKGWETVFSFVTSKGKETSMHLHDTSDDLFWEVENLGLIESHVGDPLYNLESTKNRLEETDKRLKASISMTLFDRLIENRLRADGHKEDYQQEIGKVWNDIRKNKVDPLIFVEEIDLLIQRLEELINRFGSERVPYAGPECGMSGWPRYDIAIEGLRRITKALDYYEINH